MLSLFLPDEVTVERRTKMDFDTAIILGLTACAYVWFISIGIFEEREEIKAQELEAVKRRQRAEYLKKLYDRAL